MRWIKKANPENGEAYRVDDILASGLGESHFTHETGISERALVERHAYLALFDTSKLLCSCLGPGSSRVFWCVLPLLVRKVRPPSLRSHTSRGRRARVL